MARRKRKLRAKSGEAEEHASDGRAALDRLTLVLTLVGVSVFAIFTGYLVGQYAIRWVASPLIVSERAADPGTRVVDSSGSSPSPVVLPPVANPAGDQGPSSGPAAAQAAQAGGGAPSPVPSSAASSAAGAATRSSGRAASSNTPSSPASAGPSTSSAAQGQRTIYRVHVGHFATRQEAQQAAESLRTGNPAVPDAWVLYDSASGEYRVQAGAFSSRQRAQEFVDQLVALGRDAYIAP